MDNLFLAIFPDDEAAARISQLARRLRRPHDLQGAPLPRNRLHVSLYAFGAFAELPASVVAAAQEIVSRVKGTSFDVFFDRVQSFDRKRKRSDEEKGNPFVLLGGQGASGLISFQRLISRTVAEARVSRPLARSYTPHVTMLYDAKIVDEHPVASIGWRVREFVLVQSLVGRGVYKKLARWPLHD